MSDFYLIRYFFIQLYRKTIENLDKCFYDITIGQKIRIVNVQIGELTPEKKKTKKKHLIVKQSESKIESGEKYKFFYFFLKYFLKVC